MQNVYTSVLARRVLVTETYRTLPYEAGWATEAIAFVQTEGPHPELTAHVEVSPDGLHWIARPGDVSITQDQTIAEIPVAHFGNWLRIVVAGAVADAPAKILIHLVCKG